MSLVVYYSDNTSKKIDVNDPREAYKKGFLIKSPELTITKITSYDKEFTYYSGGNFYSPEEYTRKVFQSLGESEIIQAILQLGLVENTQKSFVIAGITLTYIAIRSTYAPWVYTINIFSGAGAEIARYEVLIGYQKIQKRSHIFEDRICKMCNTSIFDIEDINAECLG